MKKRKEYYQILKPCPKCGSKHLTIVHWMTLCFTTKFLIECYDCEYKICGKSEKKVVRKWGTVDEKLLKQPICLNCDNNICKAYRGTCKKYRIPYHIKGFLYTIVACCLMPIILVGALIYGVLYILQLLFRTINLQLEKGMRWIDKNITSNIR